MGKIKYEKEIYILLEEVTGYLEFINEFDNKEDLLFEMRQEGFEISSKKYRVFKGVELKVKECPICILEYDIEEN